MLSYDRVSSFITQVYILYKSKFSDKIHHIFLVKLLEAEVDSVVTLLNIFPLAYIRYLTDKLNEITITTYEIYL